VNLRKDHSQYCEYFHTRNIVNLIRRRTLIPGFEVNTRVSLVSTRTATFICGVECAWLAGPRPL